MTTIGDGVVSQHLGAGATETNFVGGYGQQLLFGGQAPTFSPISPSAMAAIW
jgi:hypothetical protein